MMNQTPQDLRALVSEVLNTLQSAINHYEQTVRGAQQTRERALRGLDSQRQTEQRDLSQNHSSDVRDANQKQAEAIKQIEKLISTADRVFRSANLQKPELNPELKSQQETSDDISDLIVQAKTTASKFELTLSKLAYFELDEGDFDRCKQLQNALYDTSLSHAAEDFGRDLAYRQAQVKIDARSWEEARSHLQTIIDYKDAQELFWQVTLGLYEQALLSNDFQQARSWLEDYESQLEYNDDNQRSSSGRDRRKQAHNKSSFLARTDQQKRIQSQQLVARSYYQEGCSHLQQQHWDQAIAALRNIPPDKPYKDSNARLRDAILSRIRNVVQTKDLPEKNASKRHSSYRYQYEFHFENEESYIKQMVEFFGRSDEAKYLLSEWYYTVGCAAEDRAIKTPEFWAIAVSAFLAISHDFRLQEVNQRVAQAFDSMLQTGEWGRYYSGHDSRGTDLKAVFESGEYLSKLKQRLGEHSAEFAELTTKFYDTAAGLADRFQDYDYFVNITEQLRHLGTNTGTLHQWIAKYPILKWLYGAQIVAQITPQFSIPNPSIFRFAATPDLRYIATIVERKHKNSRRDLEMYLVILDHTGQEVLQLKYPFKQRIKNKEKTVEKIEFTNTILDMFQRDQRMLQIDFDGIVYRVLHTILDLRKRKIVEVVADSMNTWEMVQRPARAFAIFDGYSKTYLAGDGISVPIELGQTDIHCSEYNHSVTSNAEYIILKNENDQLTVYTHRYGR